MELSYLILSSDKAAAPSGFCCTQKLGALTGDELISRNSPVHKLISPVSAPNFCVQQNNLNVGFHTMHVTYMSLRILDRLLFLFRILFRQLGTCACRGIKCPLLFFTLPSASFATKHLSMPAMATLHTHPGSNSGTHGHVDVEFGSDVASASRHTAATAPVSRWCVRILNSRSRRSKSLLSHFYYSGSVYALSSVCF